MKVTRYFTIAILFIGMSTVVSCKKDYRCSCTAAGYNGNPNAATYNSVTKKEAMNKCNDFEKQLQNAGVQQGIYGIACKTYEK